MKITFEQDSGNVVVWDSVPEEELSKFLNVSACAKHLGINENTAWARMSRGWPVLMALATEDNKQ
ncbi:MAG: hypothetical protein E6559_03245 [Pantoea sp.]|uniref:hypothetical protein n=1 Tax=Pantoea piersonii TaxID=2364647 RepID=UPI0028AFBF91|nr:hypothetical protein [Pantoea piersonii]MDU6438924.1 hypothetical protein [Pantoea sp.]